MDWLVLNLLRREHANDERTLEEIEREPPEERADYSLCVRLALLALPELRPYLLDREDLLLLGLQNADCLAVDLILLRLSALERSQDLLLGSR